MNRKFWGQGLMTEAIEAVIDFGFERMELNRIEASCKPENIGSWRVMEKTGMKFEGTIRQSMIHRGEFFTKECRKLSEIIYLL